MVAGTAGASRKRPLGPEVLRRARSLPRSAIRSACLLAALIGVGHGCVLPIAPDFEPEKNEQPILINANPASGRIVLDQNARFDVEVGDPNSADTLYARWLIDYPPYNDQITPKPVEVPSHPGQPAGQPNRFPISFQPRCPDHMISPALSRHRLMLVVSDRPFIDEDDDPPGSRRLDLTPSDAYVLRLNWIFDKECH
jgi:hypothetical protein